MTPESLSAALAALHGDHRGAIADAGRSLGVNPDSLRHMLHGRRPVPDGLAGEINRRLALREIPPPPATLRPEDDRDEPCCQALHPHLDALAARAVASGWHPAEICAAALGWALDHAAENAGSAAAQALLDDAREVLELCRLGAT